MENNVTAEKNSTFKELRRIFSFIKTGKSGYVIGLLGSSLIGAGASLLVAFAVKDLLDAAILRDNTRLMRAVIYILISIGILSVFAPLFNYIFKKTVHNTMAGIRLMVIEHLERVQIRYYESTHSGEIISRVNNDIQALEETISDNIFMLVSTCLTGISSAVLMFIFDWRTAVILIILGVVSSFVNIGFAGPARRISDNMQEGLSVLTEKLSDLISGMEVMKMFNIVPQIKGRYDEANVELSKISMRFVRLEILQGSANYLLGWLNFGGIMLIGAIMAIYGTISFGSLVANIQLLNGVTSMFLQLGGFVTEIQTSIAGAVRVYEILDEPLEEEPIPEEDNLQELNFDNRLGEIRYIEDMRRLKEMRDIRDLYTGRNKNKGSKSSGALRRFGDPEGEKNFYIEVDNLDFSYEEGKKALDGISLKLRKGSMAALAGPSGGGKSTLVKLLMGFYKPDGGDIRINGRSIKQYTLEELRNLVAYVPQDAYLFEDTILQNILYGRNTAGMDQVMEAARTANAHEFIMDLPEGYNTLVGERGARLSGGQRQRIAIARAILKNSPILILDEATSSLDSESEHLVQDALEKLMKGKTVIAIAHRLSTIENAHVIYIIENGRIVESGNHMELFEDSGLYKQLYELQ